MAERSAGHVYGVVHKEARRRMLADMAAGRIPSVCSFCGEGPKPGPEWAWEADHRIPVALGGGPEVRPSHRFCNRSAGAQLLKQLRDAKIEARAQERIRETERLLRGRAG